MPTAQPYSSTASRVPIRTSNGMTAFLSGRGWAAHFPVSVTTSDLAAPFRGNVERFIEALDRAGATVVISSTFRTRERGYLMHWAWRIVNEHVDPANVPSLNGVNISWMHPGRTVQEAHQSSIAAARQMLVEFDIVRLGVPPALMSRHMVGFAIDMTIRWNGSLSIVDAAGNAVVIDSIPRTGLNHQLHRVGASYGVIKFNRRGRDDPHWSDTGA